MAKAKETQRTGKEGELRVMGELLRQGFNHDGERNEEEDASDSALV